MEMLTKANVKFLEESTKAIKAFEQTNSETNAKVEKLSQEVQNYMVGCKTSSNSNTKSLNKVIAWFGNSLQAEKEALSVVRSAMKLDNAEFTTSIVTKIKNFEVDLATENKITDQLDEKTQRPRLFW